MSEPKHTAAPWHQDGLVVKDSQNNIIAYIELERSDAARIVQCVNACEGMDDPEKYHREMKEIGVRQLWDELESLRAENAELIEALSATLPILNDVVHEQIDWVRIIVRTTLAKYEKP